MSTPLEPPPRTASLGHTVAGALLVLFGLLWLLEASDAVDVPWRSLLPAALMIVGLALVVGSARARHGGLIALGVILSVAVVLSAAIEILIDVPLGGGIGEEMHRPAGDTESEYRWGIGSMTVDLTDARFVDDAIDISVGIGELIVILPDETRFDIEATVGLGEVQVGGERSGGIGRQIDVADPGAVVLLRIEVGIGKAEVKSR